MKMNDSTRRRDPIIPEGFVPAEPGTPLYDQREKEVLAIMDDDSLTEEEILDKLDEYPDRAVVDDVTDMFLSLLVPVDKNGKPLA